MERTVKAKGEALARPRREAIQVPVEGDEFELLRTYAKEPDGLSFSPFRLAIPKS